ncbi:hypothetical protein TNCV_4669311 [Trichonephila clavipes]|nr:hypothetical protein TNCV_4669311 [Trichonephila clavipes]
MNIKLKNDIPVCQRARRLSCSAKLQDFLSLGSGNEGKREIVLNRRPELYRGKYRCVQPKINLLKDVLMPVKQCFPVEPSGCRRGAFMMEKMSSSAKL